jgi:hypothetical protein
MQLLQEIDQRGRRQAPQEDEDEIVAAGELDLKKRRNKTSKKWIEDLMGAGAGRQRRRFID